MNYVATNENNMKGSFFFNRLQLRLCAINSAPTPKTSYKSDKWAFSLCVKKAETLHTVISQRISNPSNKLLRPVDGDKTYINNM